MIFHVSFNDNVTSVSSLFLPRSHIGDTWNFNEITHLELQRITKVECKRIIIEVQSKQIIDTDFLFHTVTP